MKGFLSSGTKQTIHNYEMSIKRVSVQKHITEFLLLVQKVHVIEYFQCNFDLTLFESRFFRLLALGDKRN